MESLGFRVLFKEFRDGIKASSLGNLGKDTCCLEAGFFAAVGAVAEFATARTAPIREGVDLIYSFVITIFQASGTEI